MNEKEYLAEEYIKRYQQAGIEGAYNTIHQRPELIEGFIRVGDDMTEDYPQPLLKVFWSAFTNTLKGRVK